MKVVKKMTSKENEILQNTKQIAQELDELKDFIYHNPELSFQEEKSSRAHHELLKQHGFVVEQPFVHLDTAFCAVYDSQKPGPTICYMAEYDALPDIGHGCGHNILGATSTGAGIVLSKMVDDVGGRVIVLGTPAEETSGAKVNMANAGVFTNIDAAIMMHPSDAYRLSGSSLSMVTRRYEFYGKTSHAASQPEEGINALDAQIVLFSALNAFRQQTREDARIHGVIVEGGKAANVIPEYTDSRFYVRASDKKYMLELAEKLDNMAQAAALATGCRVEISEYELGYDNLVSNQHLNQLLKESLSVYTEDEVLPGEVSKGSVDAGNVSHACPTIHGYFPIAQHKLIGHTREFGEATCTDYAHEQMLISVAALARCGYCLLTEPQKLKQVKEEYEQAVEKGIIIPPDGEEKYAKR